MVKSMEESFPNDTFNNIGAIIFYKKEIGTPVEGRNDEKLENQLGMFVNTIALITHPSNKKTFDDFLKETQKTTLESFENYEDDSMTINNVTF